jgi:hypothetical protein
MKSTEILECLNDIIRLNLDRNEVDKLYPYSERLCDDAIMEMRSIALDSLNGEYQEVAKKISKNGSDNVTIFIFPFVVIELNIDLRTDALNFFNAKIAKLADESKADIILDVFAHFIKSVEWRKDNAE